MPYSWHRNVIIICGRIRIRNINYIGDDISFKISNIKLTSMTFAI